MSWQHGLFLRVLCLGAGYLFGCFLTAEIVARCTAGCSAREIGTGNPGMANILTHLGKPAGFLVLAGDVLKTAAACWFCWQAAPELGHTALLYGGLGAVLGHNWPFWNKFRGGKGVAVNCTWLILYLPITGALCCLAGGGAVLLSGYLPLGAVLIAALAVLVAWLQYGGESAFIMARVRRGRRIHMSFLSQIEAYQPWNEQESADREVLLARMRRGEEPQFFRKWHY